MRSGMGGTHFGGAGARGAAPLTTQKRFTGYKLPETHARNVVPHSVLLWLPWILYLMCYAPALRLFLKRPHGGGTWSKKLPQKRKERGSPRQPQTTALEAPCLTLTVARLGLATRLLSFASEPL